MAKINISSYSEGYGLWRLRGKPLYQVKQIFIDEENTDTVVYVYLSAKQTFTGLNIH